MICVLVKNFQVYKLILDEDICSKENSHTIGQSKKSEKG